ncbi:MAG: HNH endonuclease [Chloroflexi bacterium]|nr:HNH endonuclease [Chloroflexota bacterium]
MTGKNIPLVNRIEFPFQEGQHLHRQRDLHDRFGGNRQSGIAPCANYPFVFLFSSTIGRTHGYADGWLADDVFLFSGESQYGDMEMKRGNRAIADHAKDSRELHLFKKVSSGVYAYLGQFACESHTLLAGEDTEGRARTMIQFRLRKL